MAYLRDVDRPPKKPPHRRGYVLNALAFSTLLSSQGADAHLQRTLVRLQGNYSNLPGGILVVNQVPRNFSDQLGVHPPKQHYPTSFRGRAKPAEFVLPGGSRRSRLAAWPFRSPAGKKNIIGGRSRRQIKRRSSRRLALGPSQAFAQKPRSQAVRTVPPSPQIRSGPTAGTPGRADHCCRLIRGFTRLTPAGNLFFYGHRRRSGRVQLRAAQNSRGGQDRGAGLSGRVTQVSGTPRTR